METSAARRGKGFFRAFPSNCVISRKVAGWPFPDQGEIMMQVMWAEVATQRARASGIFLPEEGKALAWLQLAKVLSCVIKEGRAGVGSLDER